MFVNSRLPDGSPVRFVIDRDTEHRLRDSCFRGRHLKLAGNCSRWEDPEDLKTDLEFGKLMLAEALRAAEQVEERTGNNSSHRATLEFDGIVGWASTDILDFYHPNALETVDLRPESGRACHALRVKPEYDDVLAPRTNLLAVAYSLVWERRGWRIMMRAMYPGVDIGPVRGNISRRKNIVFFSPDHPGA